jgi:superfamily II DNA or RNA helicase
MQIDKKRLAEQEKILDAWIQNKGTGTVIGPTGFGKSYIGVLAVISMNTRHPLRSAVIIVPTNELKKQWEQHISTHKLINTTVFVVNTAIKRKIDCNLLILDEVHRYAADTFKLVFSKVTFNFVLGLTATFSRTDNKHYLLEKHCPVIYTMSLNEAKKKNYVSDYQIYNLAVEMNASDTVLYESINKKFNYYFSWFEFDFHRAKLCLSDKVYTSHYAIKMNTSFEDVRVKAINFFRVMGQRKAFLYGNSSKLKVIKQILDNNPVKTIVFSETTSFADTITEIMKEVCASAHTSTSSKQRDDILSKFSDSNSNIRILSTAKMYDEGIDLPDVELALIASGTSSKRQSIQRIGRAIRKKEGKKALIVNLYMTGTQEFKWVDKRTEGLNPLWITRYDQINNEGVLNPALNFDMSSLWQ